MAPNPPNSREFRPDSANGVWSGRRDLNPRHSAWEADALRRYPTHPQRVTSPTVHPLPRPLPRPASSRCTSLHDRPSEQAPRAASASRHRRHPWPAQRAVGPRSGHGRDARRGRTGGTRRLEVGDGSERTRFTKHERPRYAPSRCARNSSRTRGRRRGAARPATPTRGLNEPLVEIAVKPREVPDRRCAHALRDHRVPRPTTRSLVTSVRLLIAMRSRLPATAEVEFSGWPANRRSESRASKARCGHSL